MRARRGPGTRAGTLQGSRHWGEEELQYWRGRAGKEAVAHGNRTGCAPPWPLSFGLTSPTITDKLIRRVFGAVEGI